MVVEDTTHPGEVAAAVTREKYGVHPLATVAVHVDGVPLIRVHVKRGSVTPNPP